MSSNVFKGGSLPNLSIPPNVNPISSDLQSPASPARKQIFSLEEAIAESGIVGHARSPPKTKRKHRPAPYTLQPQRLASESSASSGSSRRGSNPRSFSAQSTNTSPTSLSNDATSFSIQQADGSRLTVPLYTPFAANQASVLASDQLNSPSVASFTASNSGYLSSVSMQASSSSNSRSSDPSFVLSNSQPDLDCAPSQTLLSEVATPADYDVEVVDTEATSLAAKMLDDEEMGPDPLSRRGKRGLRLTANDRKRICEYAQRHPELSQDAMGSTFGVERTTISKILKGQKKWLSMDTDAASPPAGAEAASEQVWSAHAARFPKVEQLVIGWIRQENTAGRATGDAGIREAARHFALELGISYEQFKASDGWMIRFKSRAGLRKDGFLRGFHEPGMSPPPTPLSCPPAFQASFVPLVTSPPLVNATLATSPQAHSPLTTSFVERPMLLRDNVGNTMSWTNAQNLQSLQYQYSPVEELQPAPRAAPVSVDSSSSSGGSGYFSLNPGSSSSAASSQLTTPASDAVYPSPALESKISLNEALQANFTLWRFLHEKNGGKDGEAFGEETSILIDIYKRLSGVIA